MTMDLQKDYQRQKERLKAMGSTTDKVKPISADLMIDNLLKETTQMSQLRRMDPVKTELPKWLQCESATVPPEYKYFWSLVLSNTEFADTQKVSQLLLTSGLHIDVLGYIWNIANKAVPGQLTKQEFYIVLALVNLAQSGATFNNLSVLKLIPTPVIPALQINVLKKEHLLFTSTAISTSQPQTYSTSSNSHMLTPSHSYLPSEGHKQSISNIPGDNPQPIKKSCSTPNYNIFGDDMNSFVKPEIRKADLDVLEVKSISSSDSPKGLTSDSHSSSNFPYLGSSPTTELEDDFSDFQSVTVESSDTQERPAQLELNDEFSEFQSASTKAMENLDPFETVVITSQKRDIPKIPLPKNMIGKFTNLNSSFLKISPESERKLKVLSHNESLASLPESKISSTNKVSTSLSVLGCHGIGSRLANHSLNVKSNRPKLHKHHRSKSNSIRSPVETNEEEIIFGVNTKNLVESVIPKCCPKKTTFLLKETKVVDDGNDGADQSAGNQSDTGTLGSGENTTRVIEIPMLGTFNETVLPTQVKSQPGIDLISVEEDKYSALRDLCVEEKPAEVSAQQDTGCDDFGDFLSAEIPPPRKESSTVLLQEVPKENTPNSLMESEDDDKWGAWNFNSDTNNQDSIKINELPLSNNSDNIRTINEQVGSSFTTGISNVTEPFELLSLEEPFTSTSQPSVFDIPESDSSVLNSNSEPSNLDSLGTVPTCNFYPNSDLFQNTPSPLITYSSENDQWNLLDVPGKQEDECNLNRRDSLPSLDLKTSTGEDVYQDMIQKKCLESCQIIIQEAVEIFDGIQEKSVLQEVLTSPKTKNYLNCLTIAYQITRRINQNCAAESYSGQEELNRLWAKLEKLCLDNNIQMESDVDSSAEGRYHCKICLGYLDEDCVQHGGQIYHPSCANLWVNCIDATLPCSS
ncbi:hypothetical protein RUM43_005787 [Polyplax serrata]|uniref:EH domain-containing protein n=1 Tax=Polyplax serrata TaxID=468196 RepID=A0AAN8NXC5_POLSC